MSGSFPVVMPAKAGIQAGSGVAAVVDSRPRFREGKLAGMTKRVAAELPLPIVMAEPAMTENGRAR